MARTFNSTSMENEIHQLIIDLHEIGVVQFGKFILKSGIESPFYIDLRLLFSKPALLGKVCDLIWNACPPKKWDLVCGVPITGLPIATIISFKQNIPMVIVRKEAKSYGMKKLIEGVYCENQSCLIIEDVMVSGTSIFETVEKLKKENLVVTDVAVFLDRSQGGNKNLKDKGINVFSAMKVSEILQVLHNYKKIDDASYENCLKFLEQQNSVPMVSGTEVQISKKELPFMERAAIASHPLVKRIHNTIINKKTNLCVAVDVSSPSELIRIANLVGPYICILKTHINTLKGFSKDISSKLTELSIMHDFLLFEDSKFGDIGETVLAQFQGSDYIISSWADLVTFHGVPGPGVVKGLKSGIGNREIGFVIVAEMSSEGNLCNADYAKGCVQIAAEFPENVIGFVAQSSLCSNPNQLLFTPGINLQSMGDNLGQQYISVEEAILHRGTDIIIVGRGITNSNDLKAAAQTYKERGFEALMKRHASDSIGY